MLCCATVYACAVLSLSLGVIILPISNLGHFVPMPIRWQEAKHIHNLVTKSWQNAILLLLMWQLVCGVADLGMGFAAYAAKKAELAEERKRREAERAAAKEARQQAMRNYMEHNFLQVPPSLSLLRDIVPTTPVALHCCASVNRL